MSDAPLQRIAVGAPWPHPAPEGMQAIISPTEGGLQVALAAALDNITGTELEALIKGPIRLGIATAPPLTWLLLDAGILSLDAPYARGIASPGYAREIAEAAAQIGGWQEQARGLVELYVIDRGLVAGIRLVSLSRDWWSILAAGLRQPPERLERATYDRAVTEQQARWTTPEMLARARIVEVGGRL